jgi:hypothetical protein
VPARAADDAVAEPGATGPAVRKNLADDRIADADFARGEDLGAKAAAVGEAAEEAGLGEGFEVAAGVAEFDSATADGADSEFAADQGIKCDASGQEVTARLGGGEDDAVIAFERGEGFGFNEREFGVGFDGGGGRVGWKVMVALKSAAGDGARGLKGDRRLRIRRADVEGEDFSGRRDHWEAAFCVSGMGATRRAACR